MSPRQSSPVTLKVIADELGISAKSVSNAFSRPDQLSDELREQVLATARRLGYAGPNPLAAGLRRGRVGAIGVAYDNGLSYAFHDRVAVELLAGLTAVAEPVGAGLLLVPGSADPQRRVAAVNEAVIDGLIVSSVADDDPLLAAALGRGLPLAVVDQPRPAHLARLGGSSTPWIGVDDRSAARTIAEHLLGLGHRQLGVISFALRRGTVRAGLTSPAAQKASPYAVTRDRLAGFRDAVTQAGMDWRSVPVYHAGDRHLIAGERAANSLLDMSPRPTALLCLSDRLAEGALRGAAHRGFRVPDDLSVTGFDDADSAAGLHLTTIRQPTRRKGELAGGQLLDRLAGHDGTGHHLLDTELVVRATTGPVPPL